MESSSLAQCLQQQRAAFRANPYPDLAQRRSHLAALHRFLKENETSIIEAIDADFGGRSATETRMLELFPVRQGIRDAAEVIQYVNDHQRPLAFYPFTYDRRLAQRYITEVLSGSVGVNEAIVQVGQHDLPFGGVGASGMGHYHGHEVFLTFYKLRPVFHQGRFSATQAMLQPPYGKLTKFATDWLFWLRG